MTITGGMGLSAEKECSAKGLVGAGLGGGQSGGLLQGQMGLGPLLAYQEIADERADGTGRETGRQTGNVTGKKDREEVV